MLGIPVVLIAIGIVALIFREGMKDGTAYGRGWGIPVVAAFGLSLVVVAAGVLLNWGFVLAS